MRIKKVLAISLVAVSFLTACGKADTAKDETVKEEPSVATESVPRVGLEQTDHENFKYLYKERFITPRDTRTKPASGGKDVTLFVPDTKDGILGRSDYRGERLGVDFAMTLNPPDLMEDDYTLEEYLNQYMEDLYICDSSYSYAYPQNVQFDQATVSAGGKAAVSRATYIEVDYNDENRYKESTAALYQMEDDTIVWIYITVDAMDASSKTSELISEINTFYGDIVQWDAEAAKKKQKDLTARQDSAREAGNTTFYTGFMSFELPDDWAQLDGVSSDTYIYTSGYNYTSEQLVLVSKIDTRLSAAEVETAILKEEMTEDAIEAIRELLDLDEQEFTYSYDQGGIGKAVCVVVAGFEDGMEEQGMAYITVGSDGVIYVMAAYTPFSNIDETTIEVLDLMFNSAELLT